MSIAMYPLRVANPELTLWVFRLQGNTTSALTLKEPAASAGVALARTSEGIHTITFTHDPGNFVGIVGWALEDTTPANIHDYWVACDSYASKVLTFTVTDVAAGTPELQDLATTSYLSMIVAFKRTSL